MNACLHKFQRISFLIFCSHKFQRISFLNICLQKFQRISFWKQWLHHASVLKYIFMNWHYNCKGICFSIFLYLTSFKEFLSEFFEHISFKEFWFEFYRHNFQRTSYWFFYWTSSKEELTLFPMTSVVVTWPWVNMTHSSFLTYFSIFFFQIYNKYSSLANINEC